VWWIVAAGPELAIGVTYLAIAYAIGRPLVETGQLFENRLGLATALIFFFCAGRHILHVVHLADSAPARAIADWHMTGWTVLTAVVGAYYWSLRRMYAPQQRGAKLFDDFRERQRQAIEINDNLVQGLSVARLALSMNDHAEAERALDDTLHAARAMIDSLLDGSGNGVQLVRSTAASLERPTVRP
jgi:signal transduction histidine kinase